MLTHSSLAYSFRHKRQLASSFTASGQASFVLGTTSSYLQLHMARVANPCQFTSLLSQNSAPGHMIIQNDYLSIGD